MAEGELDFGKHIKRLNQDLENINKWPHHELLKIKDVDLDNITDIKNLIESQILILTAFKFILNDSDIDFIPKCNDKLIVLSSALSIPSTENYKLIFESNKDASSLEYISQQFGVFTTLIPVAGGKNTSKKSSKKSIKKSKKKSNKKK